MKILGDFTVKFLTRFPMARWSPIPLRLIVGYGFMQHGFAKLSRGPDAFVAILQAMGVPAPHFMAWLTILTELLGGLAVLLGAFVTIVSVPMMAVLLVAMFTVHLPYGFSSIKLLAVTATGPKFGPVGYEVILVYLACLAALVIGGSGPFAIDGLIDKLDARDDHERGTRTPTFSLEVITLPVSDVERALRFYVDRVGFRLDVDYSPNDSFRVVQLTPPGSSCSIQLGNGLPYAPIGSLCNLYLVVSDVEAARSRLLQGRVEVSEIRHKTPIGAWDGGFAPGLDPTRQDYASFAGFSDPDGNSWVLQERGFRNL
jgi:uncharacterized membrane protein YphA (DoxX/SURF4 family)/catechol 2,3-dioxygenase-like lactoylglutathione lyase family enzyme